MNRSIRKLYLDRPIEKRFSTAGLCDIAIESDTIAEGSVSRVLKDEATTGLFDFVT